MIKPRRFDENPLITPDDVKPSRGDFEVMCAFNPAAFKVGDEYRLLLRVAERPPQEEGYVTTPVIDPENPDEYRIIRFDVNTPGLDLADPRLFSVNDVEYLTSISHLRMARSTDGRQFTVDERPLITGSEAYEVYGVEDPRVTYLEEEGRWLLAYAGISPTHSITPVLLSTTDWEHFERICIPVPPSNKDVSVFPEKINGEYVLRHRPMPKMLAQPSIWTAYSTDLVHWGRQEYVMGARRGEWDCERVGGGGPAIKTEKGWLEFFHASDYETIYRLGVLLTALDHPSKVIYRDGPLLEPEAPYELTGLLGKVVFTNGAILDDDGRILLYYGAADSVTCGAEMHVDELLDSLDL